ncbi:hypothetical protein ASU31_03260 [Pedobacter ginsenosidimutans]|uniref:Uncharacterized protein n=1 Tax=Pedobacter ginsenosidimutans TaxID=687842 RepID=A0A0T5VUL4_9SPHI|nr:hypothetical protein ASU31_03260 [Pedobacter ginsenosidimutans]
MPFFKANTVDGIYFPDSIVLMVCLETRIRPASSACVMFLMAIVLFYKNTLNSNKKIFLIF